MAQLAARIAPSKPQVPPPAQPEYTERSRKPDYQSSEPTYPPRRPQPPIPAPKAQTPQYFDHQNQNKTESELNEGSNKTDSKESMAEIANEGLLMKNENSLSDWDQASASSKDQLIVKDETICLDQEDKIAKRYEYLNFKVICLL